MFKSMPKIPPASPQDGAAAGTPAAASEKSKTTSASPQTGAALAGSLDSSAGTAPGTTHSHLIIGGSLDSPHYKVAGQHGLGVTTNRGAGDCGPIVIHEELTKIDKYKDLTVQNVRDRLADEIAKDPEFFAGFVVGAQFECEGRGILEAGVFDSYVANLRRPGTYIDNPEWTAARRAFPELPPIVFVTPTSTSDGMKLVQAFFGDSSSCTATKHLQTHKVSLESSQALDANVVIIYYTKSHGGHFESTRRVAPVPVAPVAAARDDVTSVDDEEAEVGLGDYGGEDDDEEEEDSDEEEVDEEDGDEEDGDEEVEAEGGEGAVAAVEKDAVYSTAASTAGGSDLPQGVLFSSVLFVIFIIFSRSVFY